MCDLDILKAPNFCSLANEDTWDTLQGILKKVRMIDFQRNKAVGIRAGPNSHDHPELFLEMESTQYFEMFFSLLLPHWKLPWWLSHGLEASVGYDRGTAPLFDNKGILSANGFLNYQLTFAGWQYASFPIVLVCGGGPGIIGINALYSKGQAPYAGDKGYNRGISKFAGNAFIGIELPISGRFRLQVLARRIFGTPIIKKYADLPFDKSVEKPPVGSLNGWFFVGGIKFVWR